MMKPENILSHVTIRENYVNAEQNKGDKILPKTQRVRFKKGPHL